MYRVTRLKTLRRKERIVRRRETRENPENIVERKRPRRSVAEQTACAPALVVEITVRDGAVVFVFRYSIADGPEKRAANSSFGTPYGGDRASFQNENPLFVEYGNVNGLHPSRPARSYVVTISGVRVSGGALTGSPGIREPRGGCVV